MPNGHITEADARIVIDRKLREAGWILEGQDRNVRTEQSSEAGLADYLLLDRNGRNLAIVEAKCDSIDPYLAKEQARGYAEAKGCRYVFLANSEQLYYWDLDESDARPIEQFISPDDLERRHHLKRVRRPLATAPHNDTIAERPYQREASAIIAKEYDDQGKRAFLLEMATGTGKTRLAAALIERFLRANQAERVLFIVDRIQLRKQTVGVFQAMFRDTYSVAHYIPGQRGKWGGASVVVATIQSLNLHFREDFTPGYFDLVFNDECHRSIYGDLPRQVVEYFQATRIGLTATPRDFLRNVDVAQLTADNPKALEARMLRDTYKHFGCEPGVPTFRYSIQDAVKDGFLVPQKIFRMMSLITRDAASDGGWNVEIDGEDYTFTVRQLERQVLIPERNRLICQQFMENAQRAPDGSIGKTIVFAVSQNHAALLARTLNELQPESKGKFAQVITSNVQGASDLAKVFQKEENRLPRVAVTVDMLSTGFDAPEILNLVLARPIASPVNYIQIKGRGTRTHTFADGTKKTHFIVHDFCGVADYFEEEYDYDAPLPAPVAPGKGIDNVIVCGIGGATVEEGPATYGGTPGTGGVTIAPPAASGPITYTGPDALVSSALITVGPEGEKVDRMLYRDKWEQAIKAAVVANPDIAEAAKSGDFSDEVTEYIAINILNRPEEYFNEGNLAKVYRVFASIQDYVRAALGSAELPTPEQQLDVLIQSLTAEHRLNLVQVGLLRVLVRQLAQSSTYAHDFVSGNYHFLDNPPFTGYGGVSAYAQQFGDNLQEIFRDIQESHALKLALTS